MDSLPLWFWLPAAIILWALVLVPVVRSMGEDPYDAPTGMDVLEQTGSHPHG